MTGPKVVVICINYNRDDETKAFVSEVMAQEPRELTHVVAVDNTPNRPAGTLPLSIPGDGVFVLAPGSNLGYFGGAAYGLKTYLEKHPMPEWVIVSNTDIAIEGKEFFRRLCDHSFPGGKPGIVAPTIRATLLGIDQNPHLRVRPRAGQMHFYKWVFHFYWVLYAYHVLSFIKRQFVRLITPFLPKAAAVQQNIYAAHGSFMIFNKSYFDRGGTLNHGTFLFGEEIFVAETALRLGMPVTYVPDLVVLHQEHSTTGYLPRRKIASFLSDSARYCADEFFSKSSR